MQCFINWHSLDQCSVEELAKLCHQAAPLVLQGVIAEEAVEWGVKGVCDLHLWPQRIDYTATSTGLRVEDSSGKWTDRAPGLSQRVIILHLKSNTAHELDQHCWPWLIPWPTNGSISQPTLLPPADWEPPLWIPWSVLQWHTLDPGTLQLCAWFWA